MGAAFPEPGAGSPRHEENGPGQQLTDPEVQVTPAKLLAMLFGVKAGCFSFSADVSGQILPYCTRTSRNQRRLISPKASSRASDD